MLHAAIGYVLELCAFKALPKLLSEVYNIDVSDKIHLFKNKERQCTYTLVKKINILFYFPVLLSQTIKQVLFWKLLKSAHFMELQIKIHTENKQDLSVL